MIWLLYRSPQWEVLDLTHGDYYLPRGEKGDSAWMEIHIYIFQLIKPTLRQMFQFMKSLVIAALLICENWRYGSCFIVLKSGPWNLAVNNENLGHGRFSINKTRVTTISGH
jgi:hypothetical protein